MIKIWYVFCNFVPIITLFMKTRFFLIIPVLIITFFSCNLDSSNNYTPQIIINRPFNQNGDSLKLFLTDTGGELRLDTIHVGDTISISLILNAYSNNLTAFYLKQSSSTASEVILPDKEEMDSVFITGSDYNSGKFLMKGDSPILFFPFKYIAKEISNEAKISFTVVSDAKFDIGFGSNTATLAIKTPIISNKK